MERLTPEQVTWMYRLLLGREPENPDIINQWCSSYPDTRELCWAFISSGEFQQLNPELTLSVTTSNGLALPHGHLLDLVAGNSNVFWYLKGGMLAQQSIIHILEKNGFNAADFSDVLDFGCGCGRVIRHWYPIKARLFGTDYNAELVEWCSSHLNFAEFSTNGPAPPTAYASNQFDFIYALSVFTHLPAVMQIPWLLEMKRILRPQGLILLSLHGESYKGHLRDEEKERFSLGELVVHHEELAGSNICNAYHPEDYLKREFGKALKVVDCVEKGAWGNPDQDTVLLQNTRSN